VEKGCWWLGRFQIPDLKQNYKNQINLYFIIKNLNLKKITQQNASIEKHKITQLDVIITNYNLFQILQ
jgi:hypothetical protein